MDSARLGRCNWGLRQTIGLIEKGDYSPSVTMALKLAAVFQVTVEEVFI